MPGAGLRRIDKTGFTQKDIAGQEFENCLFSGCDFSRSDLGGCVFWDCIFEDCDLSLAVLTDAVLREVAFKGCKMLGMRFDMCNKLGLSISFEKCRLDHSSFSGLKIPNTVFRDCTLREADFEQCCLSGASFGGCDLDRTIFLGSDLTKADFSTAYGFTVDPEANSLSGARFSAEGLAGLLVKYKLDIIP